MDVDDKTNLERKFSDLAGEPNSGLIVLLDAFTYVNHDFIVDQAARYRIPAVYTVSFFTEAGGLASSRAGPAIARACAHGWVCHSMNRRWRRTATSA